MNDGLSSPDFGAGLSLDELVGMMAWEINQANLPIGEVYLVVGQAAALMVAAGLKAYMLMEIWADGHTVWQGILKDDPVVVSPSGKLIRGQS